MKAVGQITIEDRLVLNNPTLEIRTVNYDWSDYSVYVECTFQEENTNYKHFRVYKFSSEGNGELTSTDIISFIKNHEILNVFK